LGGLIIRAALPHLAEYSTKFFTYMSLSSPHLGDTYNSNKLFDAGMWVLKNCAQIEVSDFNYRMTMKVTQKIPVYIDLHSFRALNGFKILYFAALIKTNMYLSIQREYKYANKPSKQQTQN
jgi:hypothetical protein